MRPSPWLLPRLATLATSVSLPPMALRARHASGGGGISATIAPHRGALQGAPGAADGLGGDEHFMRAAIIEAQQAFAEDEVPIGAVLVHDGKIVSAEHNRVERLRDASAHAELLCMRSAAAAAPQWRLSNSTLYVTLEPCPMCLAALHAFRVDRVVYGALNKRMGAIESALKPMAATQHPYHDLEILGGVLEDECGALMREFFQRRRERGPYVPPELREAGGH